MFCIIYTNLVCMPGYIDHDNFYFNLYTCIANHVTTLCVLWEAFLAIIKELSGILLLHLVRMLLGDEGLPSENKPLHSFFVA